MVQPPIDLPDRPSFEDRAYMLDVSRCRVPTRDTLGWLIDVLADLRFTELHLYIEHTYAHPGHDVVWRDAAPLTRSDLTWIRDRAAEAGLTLVANLNCFGHMERWLTHPAYRHRAECPDGYPSPLGAGTAPPSCLAPTPENAAFALELIQNLHEVIGGDRIMIGGDEPFELGLGRSRSEAERIGRDTVYRNHLARIVTPLVADGLEVLIWGDQFRRDPAAVQWIPEGVTVVAWNYEAPGRSWRGWLPSEFEELLGLPDDAELGFESHVRLLADGGVPFRVAAGTSTWGTLIGRNGNAAANIRDAGEVGIHRGAGGFMLCDWGDNGHWQPLAISLPSLVRASGAARGGVGPTDEIDVGRRIDRLLGAVDGTGILLDRLGVLGESLGTWTPNGTPLGAAVFDLLFPTAGEVDPDAVHAALAFVEDLEPQWFERLPVTARGRIIAAELSAACRAARLALRRLAGQSVTDSDVELVRRDQATAWLGSSRPGGLTESLTALS